MPELTWPYRPQPGPQTKMWKAMSPASKTKYIGFGGPRGGGKSYGMRSWFVSACWSYPLEACIVRRHRVDLQKNHINAFKGEMKPYIDAGYVKYNERDSAAYFKNGSILYFDYCDKPEDLEKIQGQAYDLLGLEESTQFNQHQINVMISSCRGSNTSNNAGVNFPNKVLQTFNWGGISHDYHRRLFWDEEFTKDEDPKDYLFIFAPFESNKILQKQTPEYQKQLRKLPEQLQQAWIDGDPDAFTGTMFNIVEDFHVVDQDKMLKHHGGIIPEDWKLYGSLDAATGDYCSFGLYTKSPAGYIYKIFTYYVKNLSVQDHIEAICERIARCPYTNGRKPSYILADRFAFAGNSSKEIVSHDITWADLFRERGLYLRKANDKRIQGCMALQYALDYNYNYQAKTLINAPKLRFFKETGQVSNAATIKELMALERDINNPEDIDQAAPDHAYDETRYAVMGGLTPRELGMEQEQQTVNKMADYGSQRDEEELFDAFGGEKESWQSVY